MPTLRSVLVVQYFVKTIVSAVFMGLLALAIIQSGIIDFMLEATYMRGAIYFGFSAIPILFAIDEYKSNQKMIKMIL